MNDILNNKLTFVSIRNLLKESFYIPNYQRGYRWQPSQVLALLNDIWDFRRKWLDNNRDRYSKYCLQPLVVSNKGENKWEVIDGQQRLTTLFLILQRLDIMTEIHQCYSITYETPYAENAYELDINRIKPDDSIDSYYLSEAIKTIDFWIKQNCGEANDQKRKLFTALADNDEYLAHFIWYNVSEEVKENDSLAIDIFDRLNVGKIGLTNAELIKALFMTSLPHGTDEKEVSRFRIIMGEQWDRIEVTLGQPMFWNFICSNTDDYITKIEYLFDIIKGKKSDKETDYTFNCYYQQIKDSKDSNIVEKLWKEINDLFQIFCDWYADKDCFHLIGYLITSGATIKTILDYRYETINEKIILRNKIDFKHTLIDAAQKTITIKDLNDEELFLHCSNKNEIRNVLLLFNIISILNTKDNSLDFMRFPFDKYREKDDKGHDIWDIEHIHSQSDKEIEGKDRQEWIETLMQYFTGEETYQDAKKMILGSEDAFKKYYKDEETSKIAFDFCKKLDSFHEGVSIPRRQEFESLSIDLRKFFHENDPDFKIHSLGNLTLLDKWTNRSYKNAFFPVKRMIILRKAKTGTFIPLCTQNIFLKTYSKVFGNLTSWTSKDSSDYLQTIIETLKTELI